MTDSLKKGFLEVIPQLTLRLNASQHIQAPREK